MPPRTAKAKTKAAARVPAPPQDDEYADERASAGGEAASDDGAAADDDDGDGDVRPGDGYAGDDADDGADVDDDGDADDGGDDDAYAGGDGSGSEDGSDEGSDGDRETGAGMGMAIAKILGGDVKGGKAVLAKRKTPMMKELEAQAELETGAKQRRLDKAVRRAVGVVQPDPVNLNSERALRKIATRAVVALFNSISEHQRAADGEGAEAPQRAPARRGGKRSAARTPAEEAQRAKFEALQDVRSKSSAAFDVLNAESFDDEAPSRAPKFTNNWARDDFLLDSKMDDWDDDAPKPTAAAPKPRKQNDDTPGPFLHHKKDRAKR